MHKEHKTNYTNIKIKKLPHSEIEIEGEINVDEMERARVKAVKELSENLSIPGFRKGHIPESVIVQKIGEMAIMEEAAEISLGHEYQHIIIDNKIDAIGKPQITLTKIARGNPLGFKINVAVFPELVLADYKKIAKEEMKLVEKVEITEKEVTDVVNEILKSQAGNNNIGTTTQNEEEGDKKPEAKELPALTDELVKSLGDFNDVPDFMAKLKENLLKEKESRAAEKKRIKIGEKIVEESKVDLPEILIESELNKMSAQFTGDIERMGLKMDDYLKHIKKTEEEMRKDWRKDAEKRAVLQISLNKIATEEKLIPDQKEIEGEAKHLLEHYKDADPERIRVYVETVLTNEKVFKFLESQKEGKKKENKEIK